MISEETKTISERSGSHRRRKKLKFSARVLVVQFPSSKFSSTTQLFSLQQPTVLGSYTIQKQIEVKLNVSEKAECLSDLLLLRPGHSAFEIQLNSTKQEQSVVSVSFDLNFVSPSLQTIKVKVSEFYF